KKLVVSYSPDQARIYTYLMKFLPNFLRLLDPTPGQLKTIEEKIELRYSHVAKAFQTAAEFRAETTLIDLFWKVEERNGHSIQFLNYIDKACKIIAQNIPPAALPGVKNTLFQMIVNFDEKQSRYRSYIGEISVLRQLIAEENFKLIKVEYRMPNNKSADYAFQTEKGLTLVEVVNVDLNVDKILTIQDLRDVIRHRTEQKLEEKYGGLPPDWPHSICLVQIIWGDLLNISELSGYFSEPQVFDNIVLKPMILGQFHDAKADLPRYQFLTAEQFLKSEAKQ
ncbi:MAG: hypothetical protein V3S41_03265, partial [Spirochaetia bacterium]